MTPTETLTAVTGMSSIVAAAFVKDCTPDEAKLLADASTVQLCLDTHADRKAAQAGKPADSQAAVDASEASPAGPKSGKK